jgi:tetratricopeptide (TPR) repeat protein
LDAWLDAGAHGLSEESLAALVAAGAPPLFEQLLELYRSAPGLEARIEAADPALPAAVRDSDPIAGRRTARRSTARLLAQAHAARSAGEDARAASLEDEARALDEHLAPGDPLLALLGGAWPAAPELERTARALLAFDAAIGLPRERVDLRLGRAFDPAAPTDLGAARALLTDVLVLEPDDVEARLQLALLLRRAGEADAARAELEELVRRAPDRVEGHYALGILRFLSKDWAGAEAPLLEAVRVRPALGEAHYLLGLASRQLGKLEQAARHLAVAQVVLGRSPETEQLLAAIQAELAARDAAR